MSRNLEQENNIQEKLDNPKKPSEVEESVSQGLEGEFNPKPKVPSTL